MTDRELANLIYNHAGIAPREWAAHFNLDCIYGGGFLNPDAREVYRQIYRSLRAQ